MKVLRRHHGVKAFQRHQPCEGTEAAEVIWRYIEDMMLEQFEGITRHAFTFPETKTIVTERTQTGRVFFTVYLMTAVPTLVQFTSCALNLC